MVNTFILVIPQTWAMASYAFLLALESELAFTNRMKQGAVGLTMTTTLEGIAVHTFPKHPSLCVLAN